MDWHRSDNNFWKKLLRMNRKAIRNLRKKEKSKSKSKSRKSSNSKSKNDNEKEAKKKSILKVNKNIGNHKKKCILSRQKNSELLGKIQTFKNEN